MLRTLKRTVFPLAGLVISMALLPGGRAVADETFYTLASVQTATLERGQIVLKLTANGPIAFQVIDDQPVPASGTSPALHVRLYGVEASAIGASVPTEVGVVQLAPDHAGNLDVLLQPTGAFAGQPLRVTAGRTANEIAIRLASR